MASGRYSFIDIAVLEEVRLRFAAGEALALLSIDLDEVLWANGAGAALLGHDDVESAMGAAPGLGFVAKRQIAAVPGFPHQIRDSIVMVRLARGPTSRAVPFNISAVTLPDGMPALLLAVATDGGGRVQDRIVAGFEQAGFFAAVVDDKAQVSAASPGFSSLGIIHETLAVLVSEVAHERDRLVKRLVPARDGLVPAGIARLADEPALHLVIAVDEPVEEISAPANLVLANDEPAPPDTELPERIAEAQPVPTVSSTRDSDDWYFDGRPDLTPKVGKLDQSEPQRLISGKEEEEARQAETGHTPPDLGAGPVRFSWRTDAQGAFSAISREFVEAVGSPAADVIGQSFRDVAERFGLDPDGEIAALLERRDTWSGRMVMWPVSGTDLVAPVDLAALPVYNRDRGFEGFRGFGVARMGDVQSDPQARGRDFIKAEPEPAAQDQTLANDEQADSTDPFRSEVPVISIAERFRRRSSDKIIRLAEHRPPQPEAGQQDTEQPDAMESVSGSPLPVEDHPPRHRLSPDERSAFEEIRARLQRESRAVETDHVGAEAAHETGPAESDGGTVPPRTPDENPDAEAGGNANEEPAAPQPFLSEPFVQDETAQEKAAQGTIAHGEPRTDTPDLKEDPAEASQPEEPGAQIQEAEAPEAEETAPSPRMSGKLHSGENDVGAEIEPAPLAPDARGDRRPVFTPELISALPMPLLAHAGDSLHFANREFLELTGYASLEQIKREGGLDRLIVDEPLDELTESGERKLKLRTLGGETFPVDAHLQSIGWQDGTALLLALRRAEAVTPSVPQSRQSDALTSDQQLQLAELRTIIDTATDGVVLITRDGMIRNISRPAEALFGFDSAEVEGKPFATLLAIESRKAARDYLAGLADNGVASVLNDGREVIGREREGRFIPLFMTIGRLPGDSGYCAVVRDITQFKRAEEEMTQARAQAERASSQKTEFLARVSHEIRTPLNAIIGFSELMMDEKFGPVGSDRYRDYLRDINRSGNHVLDLVNDLLDISKIEAGEQEMNYEAVSLNEALSEAVAMMQPQANRERVIIRSSLASSLPEVVADLRSVRQIVLNLLSNAIRYTQAGGQVIISTAYEVSGDVVLRVRDTGIGMSLIEIDQALKPFKQVNALRRGRHDGTGLGLPLTKAMVEANRARFSISSTPGKGTLVEIVFPSTRVLAG